MKMTGKQGVLRIFDSAAIIHGVAPLDNLTLDMVKFDGVSTWTNITTDLEADDANIATAFLTDINDKVYIGSDGRFAMIKFLKGGGTNFAAASGALVAKYYNGTDFSTVLVGVVDGSSDGTDCFAQDGYITFKIPNDWVRGANSHNANLDSDKYYIELGTTTHASTDPDADVLAPVDGQHFEVAFSQMDFSGPMGRPKCEEALVLDRNNMNAKAHYIEGMDGKKYDPLEISFSCILDDIYNNQGIINALACANAQITLESDLITNGSFGSGIASWTDNSTGNGSFAWDTDHAELDANTGTAEMGQTITLVKGKVYRLRFDISENCTSLLVTGGTAAYGGTQHFTQTFTATGNDNDIVFTAAGTSLYLEFKNSTDEVVSLDDIELYMVTSPRWNATGTTSKGTTKNDGTNYNPAFKETAKKTVNVMILFDESRAVAKTQVKPQGWAYYEVFFPMDESSIAEGEDGTILNCHGGVYGIIERIHGFGNRY